MANSSELFEARLSAIRDGDYDTGLFAEPQQLAQELVIKARQRIGSVMIGARSAKVLMGYAQGKQDVPVDIVGKMAIGITGIDLIAVVYDLQCARQFMRIEPPYFEGGPHGGVPAQVIAGTDMLDVSGRVAIAEYMHVRVGDFLE